MRRRPKLVPREAIECFEIRIVLYLTREGDAMVDYIISNPDEDRTAPPLHEVLGVLAMTGQTITADYESGAADV